MLEMRNVVEKRKKEMIQACHRLQKQIEAYKDQDTKFLEAHESYNADRQKLQSLDRKLKLRFAKK